jgi:uncharacterized membrane protein
MRHVIAYVVVALVFCALDSVWLGVLAMDFYRERIGSLLLAEPNVLAAAVFYVFYIAGVIIFAVAPALAHSPDGAAMRALLRGALLGLLAYMTYDLTNMATLRGWSWTIAAVDMAWGMFVTAVAACAGAAMTQRFVRWQRLAGVVHDDR